MIRQKSRNRNRDSPISIYSGRHLRTTIHGHAYYLQERHCLLRHGPGRLVHLVSLSVIYLYHYLVGLRFENAALLGESLSKNPYPYIWIKEATALWSDLIDFKIFRLGIALIGRKDVGRSKKDSPQTMGRLVTGHDMEGEGAKGADRLSGSEVALKCLGGTRFLASCEGKKKRTCLLVTLSMKSPEKSPEKTTGRYRMYMLVLQIPAAASQGFLWIPLPPVTRPSACPSVP